MGATEEPWAACRDASAWHRPNTRSPKKAHVGRTDYPGQPGLPVARCRPMPLDDSLTMAPGSVPEHARCQRNGCRQAWPSGGDA